MTQQPPQGDPSAPTQYQPPQQYQQAPQYPQAQQYPPHTQMPVSKPPTNVFAIIALIGAFFLSIVGIIFGHIALSQIKRTGESGRGLALAGTIIGYVRLAGEIFAIIMFFVFFGIFGVAATTGIGSTLDQLETPEPYGNSEQQDLPWTGTDQEAFCTALDDYELSYDDEYAYYEQLLAVTDDPEFAALIEKQLASFDLDFENMTDEEYDQYVAESEVWSDAHSAQLDRCYGD